MDGGNKNNLSQAFASIFIMKAFLILFVHLFKYLVCTNLSALKGPDQLIG